MSKRTPSTTTYTVDLGLLGELDVVVSYHYSPGRPGRHTMSNGDPGYPDDPAEVEIIDVRHQALSAEGAAALLAVLEDDDDLAEMINAEECSERDTAAAEAYYDAQREERCLYHEVD